jgi:hypothetical protein
MSKHTVRMTRIKVDEATWREFRGMCLVRGVDVPVGLGALVAGAVKRWAMQKPRRVYERRK